jgi:autotransporter translocation and assembly factor TamB
MTTNRNEHSALFNWLKARSKWWLLPLSFLILLGILRFSLKSEPVLNFLKTKIEAMASASVKGSVNIGAIQGDLWKGITATNINVISKDTVLHLDTLQASYDIFDLIGTPHTVQSISFQGLRVKIIQETDSTWNVMNMLPADTANKKGGGNIPLVFNDIKLRNSQISVNAPYSIPDTTLYLDEITMHSGFQLKRLGYRFELKSLSLKVHYPSLGEPVIFKTEGRATENSYSIENLLLATGQSMIKAGGVFSGDSTSASYQFNLKGKPVAWHDIKAVMDSYPSKENANVTLSLSDNVKRLELESHFRMKPAISVTRVSVKADSMNLAQLMNNDQYPKILSARVSLSGDVPLKNYKQAKLHGNAEIRDVTIDNYHVDKSDLTLDVKPDDAILKLEAHRGDENIHMNVHTQNPWANEPEWHAEATVHNLNPAYWLSDSTQSGELNIKANVSGVGLKPSGQVWKLHADIMPGSYRKIPFSGGSLEASLTDSLVDGKTQIRFNKGSIGLKVRSHWSKKEPTYTFALETHQLNLTDLGSLEEYPTSLNISLNGNGKNFGLKGLDIKAHLNADSSIVNKELLHKMKADISVKDSVLYLKNTQIKSGIADGSFEARQNLFHYDDPKNKLEYDLKVKDIHSLAPLFGVKKLQTRGDMMGDIKIKNNQLVFIAELYLNDIRYDTVMISNMQGQMQVNLTKHPDFKAYLELKNPQVGALKLQDFQLHSSGLIRDKTVKGDYTLDLSIREKAGAQQKGGYFYSADSSFVSIQNFFCKTTNRTLTLRKPGYIYYTHNTLRTDTLQIEDGNNAMFRIYLDKVNSVSQKGFFDARNLNFGSIQDVFLQNKEYGGEVSGHADFDIVNKKVTMHSNLSFAGLSYKDIKLDMIRVKANIVKGQLTADGFIEDKGNKLLVGEANLPFRLGNPTSFDTTFFSKPINGSLKMEPVNLSDYKELLQELGFEDVTGKAQFNGSLSGEAGSPDINGNFILSNADFSNVAIDTAQAHFQYEQKGKQIVFHGKIVSMKQTAAEITGSFPFSLNLKQFNINLPQEKDSINASIITNKFNLAALNEFVSRDEMKKMQGMLNGKIKVSGTIGNPVMNGTMNLEDGGVRVIPANIHLKDITADMSFEPGKIILNKCKVSSNGSLSATGDIALKGYETKNLNLQINADNFRVINTRNYKAVISMNTTLTGSLIHPKLRGNLSVNNGTIYLDNFGTKSVETVQLNQRKTYSDISLYDSLDVDMNLNIIRNFWLRNRTSPEMALELNGKVEVSKKSGDDLKVFGEFNSNQGYATQLGKRFEMQTGRIVFSGDPTNPQLDIKTLYQLRQPNDISIYYLITGTVNDPKFNYDSDPKMDLKNIISYTLFGRPFNALLSWEQSFSGSSSANGKQVAKDALMNLLMDRVESLATNKLGIDLIQIDNTNHAAGNGTTIKAGKYVTDKIFLAVLQQLGGNNPVSQVILEYYLKRNLELILTQSENSRTGIDVLWKYDY